MVFTSSNTNIIDIIDYHLTAGLQLFRQEALFQPDWRAPEHVVLHKHYTVPSRMSWGSGKAWQPMATYGNIYGNLVTW